MDKTERSVRASSKLLQNDAGNKIKTDSRSSGTGSESGEVYVNDRGQVCYGNKCVTIAIDDARHEIVINVKRDATCNIEPLVEAMRDTLGKGCRTVYEVESEERKQS